MSAVLDALSAALGDAVRSDAGSRGARSHDYWAATALRSWLGRPPELPRAVVRPGSTEAMAEAVRICRAHGAPMIPYGGGSGVCGGVLGSAAAVVLDTGALAGLAALEPTDALATFGAGTNGLAAEEAVRAEGFTIGHWPQSIEWSTVGGWVATRASGQFSTAYGNVEDVLFALEAVLPDGRILRTRGTPRASAGPDLRGLLLGSEGTLGVVTEVTFSLRELPERGVRQAFHFADLEAGLEATRRVLRAGWRPPVVRLYDPRESRRHFRETCPEGRAMLIFLHEGPAGAAELEAEAVARIAAAGGGATADPAAVDAWFEHRNTVPAWETLFEQGIVADTIEVGTSWSRLGALYHAIRDAVEAVPGVLACSAHSSHAYRSGANLYFTFAVQPEAREAMPEAYAACWEAAMGAAVDHGAGIAHHHGIGRVRAPWLVEELGEPGLDVLRAVKRALDPDGLFNPGVLLPEADP